MKCTKHGLQEWFKQKLPMDELAEKLTMAGIEVSSISPVAKSFSNIVVGEILSVDVHPDADKLVVCQVNVGDKKPLQIVCGDKKVYAGMRMPTALVNAKIEDFQISERKLRGVLSQGMLCSADELGLAETSDGILDLGKKAPVGKDVREFLGLDDAVIEIELTPNRGDCASVLGMAREVSAVMNIPYQMPKIKDVSKSCSDALPIILKNAEGCSHYVGRVIKDIDNKAKTPMWVQERLRRSGFNSINPVVDVTNYVLLELGQPMHAFDCDQLSEEIIVRDSHPDETLHLLDDTKVNLKKDTLVIADQKGVLAIAGVMGGLNSAVNENTKNIFLESAFFNPVLISQSVRRYNLKTDSSYRFERGVDPTLQKIAIERATALLLEIVGGKPGPVIEVTNKKYYPKPKTVHLRRHRIEKILGLSIDDTIIMDVLKRLNMPLKKSRDGFDVQIPTYRFDISLEIDLIEEIARIHGYHHLPTKTYHAPMNLLPYSAKTISKKSIQHLLKSRDYREVITYSFVDPKLQQSLDPASETVALINPIASNLAVMRTNIWPGLLETLQYNLSRQQNRVRFFEIGQRFRKGENKIHQHAVVAGLVYGDILPLQWAHKSSPVNFYTIKKDVEILLQLTHRLDEFEFRSTEHPALHPGQSADVFKNNRLIGHVGALHPKILQKMDIKQEVYVFELLLDAMLEKKVPIYSSISKYPAIQRDLAFIVKKSVKVSEIIALIRQISGEILTDLTLFDIFEGKNMAEDEKSVAVQLTLQATSHTLTDREVCDIIERVIETLKSNLKAKLRD